MSSSERSLDIRVIPNAGSDLSTDGHWQVTELADNDPRVWQLARSVTATEMATFYAEEHHSWSGRPWGRGRSLASYLTAGRIQVADRVLDFGCGSGRVGRHLVQHLDSGRYLGVDHDLAALKAFAAYEIPLIGADMKAPTLLWTGVEGLTFLQEGFDCVVDVLSATYLSDGAISTFLTQVARLLTPDGRLYSVARGSRMASAAREHGFVKVDRSSTVDDVLWALPVKKRTNSWVEWRVRT